MFVLQTVWLPVPVSTEISSETWEQIIPTHLSPLSSVYRDILWDLGKDITRQSFSIVQMSTEISSETWEQISPAHLSPLSNVYRDILWDLGTDYTRQFFSIVQCLQRYPLNPGNRLHPPIFLHCPVSTEISPESWEQNTPTNLSPLSSVYRDIPWILGTDSPCSKMSFDMLWKSYFAHSASFTRN